LGANSSNARPNIDFLRTIRIFLLVAAFSLLLSGGARAHPLDLDHEARAFSAGGAHSCAIRADGSIVCWGDDSQGQLDGIPAGAYSAVSAGGAHTCAIRNVGTLECWGDDSKGQLENIPDDAAGPFGAVSAGGAHTCALRVDPEPKDRRLFCWGDDSTGQLDRIRPGDYTAVSAGDGHSCVIRESRHLGCWGDDSFGQVSDAPGEWNYWHWFWHGHNYFSAVSAGGTHTCGIRFGGGIECWGDDSKGQLDAIPAGEFTALSAGGAHTCAIGEDGALDCWGDDSFGQLDEPLLGEVGAVSAGGAHTCARPAAGGLVCWGDNQYGQSLPFMVSPDPPAGRVGDPYSHRFRTTPQAPGPEFSVIAGQPPPGLALGADGTLVGKPTTAGQFTFTVAASNGVTADAEQEVTIQVLEAAQPPVQQVQSAGPIGPPPPVAGQSVNLKPVQGVVKTKCPGNRDFGKIERAIQIPLSCIVDARNGTVDLTASKGSSGQTQSADFWGGIFGVGQESGDDKQAVLTLAGRLECEQRKGLRKKKGGRVNLRRGRGAGRKLWGSGKGSYTSAGSHGAATVRGTTWLVVDRCDGSTLFKVAEGTVWVKDFAKDIQVVLQAGESYVARSAIDRLK
jgi:hypothetical protein